MVLLVVTPWGRTGKVQPATSGRVRQGLHGKRSWTSERHMRRTGCRLPWQRGGTHRHSMERVQSMYPRVVMTPHGIFWAPAESKEERSARFEKVLRAHQAMAAPVRSVAVIVDELPIFEPHKPLHRVRLSGMSSLRPLHDDSSARSVSWTILEDDGETSWSGYRLYFSRR